MLLLALVTLFAQFQGLNAQVDANGLTLADKAEAVELRLLQPGSIDFGVSPCSNNLFQDPAQGEQTAAQWTRIVFHDAITANIAAGTGLVQHVFPLETYTDQNSGLDASVTFESDREENIGVFINATIGDVCFPMSETCGNLADRISSMRTPASIDPLRMSLEWSVIPRTQQLMKPD